MDEILGFDEQIGRMPFKPVTRVAPKRPVTRVAPGRPVTRVSPKMPVTRVAPKMPVTRVAPGRPVTRVAPGRPVTRVAPKMPVTRVAPGRPVTRVAPGRPVTRITPGKPAQIRKIAPGTRFTKAVKKAMPKQAVIKPNGQVIPVTRLTQTTQPAAVKAANPIQRSFMPVDLPYQSKQPASKPLRLTATNYALPVNVNLIEPAVDAGMQDYYGK
jgi:hypothetical protein